MYTQGRSFLSYLKNVLPVWVLLVLLFAASTGSVFAFSFGPPVGKTGAPNEGTCADANCHTGNDLNASGGSLILTTPKTYELNQVYEIIVSLKRAGQNRWGFEMTALDGNGAGAGTFEVTDVANTQLKGQYIMHTAAGSAQGTNDKNQWTLKWTAPDADVGPITFYAAGNAANGNFIPAGDYIYTKQAKSTPPIPVVAGVSLEIVGDMALSTMNAVEGVSYTLKATNTGNMMDTITLEASAEVGIEGSVLGALSDRSVDLKAGAATEITVKVAGDLFTKPGDYPIRVTATSRTDGTKTAEITTTTTIEIPPPPPAPEVPPPPPPPPAPEVAPPPPPPPPAPEVAPPPPAPEVPSPPPTPWDVNTDGTVDIRDVVLVANEFGQSGESLKGDVNGDGTVNIQDLVLVASHFGEDTNAGQ